MSTFNLFLGSDRETGILDIDRIANIVVKSHDFTMMRAQGTWFGDVEDSVIVTIATQEDSTVYDTARMLKSELNQDAVGIQVIPDITFI